jgi:hypothetical protein
MLSRLDGTQEGHSSRRLDQRVRRLQKRAERGRLPNALPGDEGRIMVGQSEKGGELTRC